MNKLIIILGFLIAFFCNKTTTKSDTIKTIQMDIKPTEKMTLINLDYGFKIAFNDSEDLSNFMTYWNTNLYKDNKLIFKDSITEFEINDKYPSIRKIGSNYEILLLVNDRPSIDKLMMLKIQDKNVISKKIIPNFNMKPKDIDSDGRLEVVGIMSYYEMSSKNGNMMPYLPILVYEYTDTGITIDSVTTKKINVRVYGKFYGYDYSEKYLFEGNERFVNELKKYK